jgi:hypothetical protein
MNNLSVPVLRRKKFKDLERRFVAAMILDTAFLGGATPQVKPEHFSTPEAKTVVRLCLEHYARYKVAPGPDIQQIFEDYVLTGAAITADKELVNIYLTLLSQDYGDMEINNFLIDQAKRFFGERHWQNHKEEVELLRSTGRVEEALESAASYQPLTWGGEGKAPTLEKALNDPTLGLVVSGQDFLNIPMEPLRPILEPWLFEADTVLISGAAGVGKSYLSLAMAKIAAGGGWGMDGHWFCDNPCKVLFVDGEMHPYRLQGRIKLAGLGERFTPISKLWLGQAGVPLNFMDAKTRGQLTDYIVKNGFKVVILDNIFSLFENLDMQSDKDWSAPNSWLMELRGHGVVVVLLHHTNKKLDQYGTVTKLFNITTALTLNDAKKPGEEDATFTIRVSKGREKGLNLEGKTYRLTDGLWQVEESDTAKEEKILAMVAMGLVAGKKQIVIAEEVGKDRSWVSRLKDKLLNQEYLVEQDGLFTPTSKGESLIDQWDFGI